MCEKHALSLGGSSPSVTFHLCGKSSPRFCILQVIKNWMVGRPENESVSLPRLVYKGWEL